MEHKCLYLGFMRYVRPIEMSDEVSLLKEISKKLSQLIFLTKLSNLKLIEETKQRIKEDKVLQTILDTADGSLSSLNLKQKIMTSRKVSKPTVERRMAWLVERGALTPIRKGNEVFYENSGLYD